MRSSEQQDPYFEDRLKRARQHRVIRRFEFEKSQGAPEAEPNIQLPHPTIEGTIEEFGWSERAVNNIVDAATKGYVKITHKGNDHIRIEFLPITELPKQLGQVTELENLRRNPTAKSPVFGAPESSALTYLQTVDFAVEGYMDDEQAGKEYGRLYVDTETLRKLRNVYLDPESLHITDYEYGFAFCVLGGVPLRAIDQIDVIRARPMQWKGSALDESGSEIDVVAEMKRQVERLRSFLSER